MSNHIWIVRDPSGKVIGASVVPRGAIRDVKAHCGATTAGIMNELSRTVDTTGQHYAQDGYTLTREPLTPAPRVVVLDGFRTMNRFTVIGASVFDTVAQATSWLRHLDEEFPNQAPHRVVRVALVEDATTEVPADA
jgi:hypothetical protein